MTARRITTILAPLLLLFSASCTKQPASGGEENLPQIGSKDYVEAEAYVWDGTKRADITYQLLCYSFADSDADRYGDLKGIEQHLDYIDALGAGAVWLSPVNTCSSYHGYDVTDYYGVEPKIGTEEDLASLIEKAHAKGIKIYLDFVLNHTSKYHPWFKSAQADASSPYRDYYFIYSDGSYKCVFGDWMPDLNYGSAAQCENSAAFKDLAAAADKWIALGADGFRLDAVKHIYDDASSDENPTFLKKFYDHCNATYHSLGRSGDIYMIGEVWEEAETVAPYYKGLPAYFEFSFWNRLQWAVNNGTGRYFCKDIKSYEPLYAKYRSGYVKGTKLSNHDEDRTGSVLGKSADKEKLAAAVLLTSPGSPYIYQGEELGFYGTKSSGDEYVRGPIKWDATSSAATGALGGKVIADNISSAMSVESQSADSNSILNFYREWARLRNAFPALGQGEMSAHQTYNDSNSEYGSIAAWYMSTSTQKVLVVHNFGSEPVGVSFGATDKLDRAIAVNGEITRAVKGSKTVLTMPAYSSAVFLQ